MAEAKGLYGSDTAANMARSATAELVGTAVVTLALAATRKFPWAFVPAYGGSQLAGATVGSLATWLTYGSPPPETSSQNEPGSAAGAGGTDSKVSTT